VIIVTQTTKVKCDELTDGGETLHSEVLTGCRHTAEGSSGNNVTETTDGTV